MGRIIRHQEGVVPRLCRHCPRRFMVRMDDTRVLCRECELHERVRQKQRARQCQLARQADDGWQDDPGFEDVI